MVQLDARDQAMLNGELGDAAALAMRIVAAMAEVQGAATLLDITGAHIDSCLYLGQAGLDLAERLAAGGGQVAVPTTLNITSLDLLHPDLYRGEAFEAEQTAKLVAAYKAMGCRPTWTCAPYYLAARPGFGEHVAWAESNAIVFANSVLGARTNRYGDLIDICAALTGRVPASGLHLDEFRRAELVIEASGIAEDLAAADLMYPLLGFVIGERASARVPAIVGLEHAGEDQLRALGAAAATAGAVGMFHAVGITPEAPDLAAAFGGAAREARETITVTGSELRDVRRRLTSAAGDPEAVALGTPHASGRELRQVAELLDGRSVKLPLYMSCGRDVLAEASGTVAMLEDSGVTVVTDTCTYVTPIIERSVVMTDSVKWAYYAPGNLGYDIQLGSTTECVETAVAGQLRIDEGLWSDG